MFSGTGTFVHSAVLNFTDFKKKNNFWEKDGRDCHLNQHRIYFIMHDLDMKIFKMILERWSSMPWISFFLCVKTPEYFWSFSNHDNKDH